MGPEASARELRGTFPAHVPGIYSSLYDHLVQRGYFLHRPDVARREWIVLASVVGGLGLAAIWWFERWPQPLGLALLASAGLLFLFSRWMPVPTPRGAKMRDRILGLREYIRRAESAELEFRHAPEKTPEHFDEILPWAIALDVSDLWLQEFGATFSGTPPWYTREGAGPQPTALSLELGNFFAVTLQIISADA
jgi:hypothetical protein